jgi:hypothetical protein
VGKKKSKFKSKAKIRKDPVKKLVLIERIWAENGIVHVQEQDGRLTHMSVKQAAMRAQALNDMVKGLPKWHRDKTHNMIDQIIQTCRKAKYQLECADDGGDKKTKAMKNMLEGKTAEGKPVSEIVTDEDRKVAKYQEKFPFLEDHEIRVAINYKELREDQQEHMMEEVNEARAEQSVTLT